MARRLWTRDELVKTLALYCQIPFGQFDGRNPAVQKLASEIERTPSAVALKLSNFASFDPELQARGVGGLPHASQLDRDIWDEFFGKWDTLSLAIDFDIVPIEHLVDPTDLLMRPATADSTQSQRLVTARRGQSFFRASILAVYEYKCCVTGIPTLELLRASHIVPWAANIDSRLDPHNGLCLNALHDAAFDRGLISFDESLRLTISRRLHNELPGDIYTDMFARYQDKPIHLPERFMPSKEHLTYHREQIFQE